MNIKPVGDLTIFEVGALCEELKQATKAHPSVTVDVHEVDKLDASALQLLLALRRTPHVTVTGMSEAVHARLKTLGYVEGH